MILCDDSSTDDSFLIAKQTLLQREKRFSERFSFVLLRNEHNSGVCKTLNRCIDHIDGEYVYLTASDCYPLSSAIDYALSELNERRLDFLVSDCLVADENDNVISSSALFDYRNGCRMLYEKGLIVQELVMNWILPGPVSLMSSSIFNKVGRYDESLLVEDRDFYLRAFLCSKVGFSFEKISCYRIHSSNFSRNKAINPAVKSEIRLVNLKYRKFFGFFKYI